MRSLIQIFIPPPSAGVGSVARSHYRIHPGASIKRPGRPAWHGSGDLRGIGPPGNARKQTLRGPGLAHVPVSAILGAMKGVIVTAGYGTRFLPVTKTIPKEMLPL
ncbi:MAG TPA: hypothetical protein VHE79_11615, partial [Spirochaetia bacterium]